MQKPKSKFSEFPQDMERSRPTVEMEVYEVEVLIPTQNWNRRLTENGHGVRAEKNLEMSLCE